MADPYATRAPDLSARPTGPPPWEAAVGARGGEVIGASEPPPDPRFRVVACRGIGTLAPFARVDAPLAVLLWLEHCGGPRTAAAAADLLARLRSSKGPVFAIKQGCVGGPSDRPGCFEVGDDLVLSVLDAALADEVTWETDPDFGYEVPAVVPGIEGEAARALLPRLLYGDHDRVYEHAGLAAAKKRERFEIAESIPGLDPAVRAAAGWPPVATSDRWRD
ncbi:MAG: hypothetical protein U0R24_08150 [Solirubrobacterales bacterium]